MMTKIKTQFKIKILIFLLPLLLLDCEIKLRDNIKGMWTIIDFKYNDKVYLNHLFSNSVMFEDEMLSFPAILTKTGNIKTIEVVDATWKRINKDSIIILSNNVILQGKYKVIYFTQNNCSYYLMRSNTTEILLKELKYRI